MHRVLVYFHIRIRVFVQKVGCSIYVGAAHSRYREHWDLTTFKPFRYHTPDHLSCLDESSTAQRRACSTRSSQLARELNKPKLVEFVNSRAIESSRGKLSLPAMGSAFMSMAAAKTEAPKARAAMMAVKRMLTVDVYAWKWGLELMMDLVDVRVISLNVL